jgi:hypothetical protein
MTKADALLKLIQALALAGYDADRLQIEEMDDEIRVHFYNFSPARVIVAITEFWQFPTVPCYFVNFSGDSGNFCACSGTPHVERALLDLGTVINQANNWLLSRRETEEV